MLPNLAEATERGKQLQPLKIELLLDPAQLVARLLRTRDETAVAELEAFPAVRDRIFATYQEELRKQGAFQKLPLDVISTTLAVLSLIEFQLRADFDVRTTEGGQNANTEASGRATPRVA